jgi:hypothetical protein
MGNSSCSNLFCNYGKNVEYTAVFNEQMTNNQSQISLKTSQKDSNKYLQQKYNLGNQLISKLNDDVIDISKHKDLKLLINNINIREISFPVDKNKLGEESGRLYEKIEKLLTKFYPCDEKEINKVEVYLIQLFIKIKNNVNKKIKENKLIYSGKLLKLINYNINHYQVNKLSERFCVLYKNVFKYYKSEIQFLKGLKPLNILYLDQISRINLVRKNINSKKLNYIIICNKYAIEKEEVNYEHFSRDISDNMFINHSNESIIIFTSEDENAIYKWFAYMEYLIYQGKNKC